MGGQRQPALGPDRPLRRTPRPGERASAGHRPDPRPGGERRRHAGVRRQRHGRSLVHRRRRPQLGSGRRLDTARPVHRRQLQPPCGGLPAGALRPGGTTSPTTSSWWVPGSPRRSPRPWSEGSSAVSASWPAGARPRGAVDQNPWEGRPVAEVRRFEGIGFFRMARRPGRTPGSTTAGCGGRDPRRDQRRPLPRDPTGGRAPGRRERRVHLDPDDRRRRPRGRVPPGQAVSDVIWHPGRIVIAS